MTRLAARVSGPALALALAAVALTACGGGRPAATAASGQAASQATATASDPVVAEVDGTPIRRSEVDGRVAGELARIENEQYETRRNALEGLVSDRLLEHEATARGLAPSAVLKAEVEDRVAKPTQAQVSAFYQQVAPQMGGRPLAEVAPEIERHLRDQAVAERRLAFLGELKKKHKVRLELDAPRMNPVLPADAPSLGPARAPVTVVEYLDYQCPYCRRAQAIIQELLVRYPDRVRFVHRDFPLEGHPRAFATSQATRCAGEQGKFWEYHRDVLEKPSDLSDQDLRTRAGALGLKADAFAACLASGRHDASIRASYDSGLKLGVSSTPTFFVNGRRVVGARPLPQFQEVIEEELARAGS